MDGIRASGPYEVRPRQMRALVLLLVLLPLFPAAFVVRFTVEAMHYERLDARERAQHVYQSFLESATFGLAASMSRQIASRGWVHTEAPRAAMADSLADAVLSVAPDGRVLQPAAGASAGSVTKGIEQGGIVYAGIPAAGPVRWRFLCEAPEPLFALRPEPPSPGSGGAPVPLLVKSRKHLLELITEYYQRTLDPQSETFLVDENGERIALTGAGGTPAGSPLCEVALPPPLPAWRVQLFSTDEALVDGIARDQVAFYIWGVGGMLAATLAIAGVAGLALRRRLVLNELGNDALATVSHEIKTPLAAMRVLLETLQEGRVAPGEPTAEYLRLIARENERIERLAEGFLTLSRLEHADGSELPATLVAPGEVVESVCSRLRPRFEAEDCQWSMEVAPDLPPVRGDREALATALVNLIDNALKYSLPPKCIDIRALAAGRFVELRVQDQGIGIAPAEHEKIFQRFYQADQRLSRSHDGCGLGLSIVESIARAHGGRVRVESALGRGSTFTLSLPAAG